MIDEVQKDFRYFKETNPEAENINLRIIKGILKKLHIALTRINNLSSDDREHHYYIVYNGTIVMFEVCKILRKANFYKLAARYLTFNCLTLDHNLLLTTGKYLHWRVRNYIECARAHADSKEFDKSLETLKKGIEKVEILLTIEKQDMPVLDADQRKLLNPNLYRGN